ncbi:MAG: N-acetylmuramoyl-L-alanine amidase, partial [Spirochaetota bacterium]
LYINAVSAYVELGYLKMPSYRKMFSENQNEVAEGIAVGIYSLLAGTDISGIKRPFHPKGKKIDLAKYRITDTETYFDSAVK